ncbi:ABC transporter ATP-binding protein [Corynebacterium sp. ES2775-CONJ]|uniref:ABC transporter ATP-binding protein n=1 Tax=Corynebacterium sp. ES2775-CONJ TaxID=2974029 RepID=UPI0021695B2F|nr:ABC transporter ATP-binding protein [Corynebacterium sp. ES2775-CONJ]MCS4489626.1 ABC transporter ATP-binding protein [Corynebacterium sp. ES2775-CONJ]
MSVNYQQQIFEEGQPSAKDSALQVLELSVGYGSHSIISHLTLTIPRGELTVIVGPNACGKSTLLRSLVRVIPSQGSILLEGADIYSLGAKEVARKMGLLPQSPVAPDGIVVADLIARGRYPHQDILGRWTKADEKAVESAMRRAHVLDLREKRIDELSGGQRQRVWLALVLAQDTPIVLLDEPTTYLDITHQVEVLNLARDLQRHGVTVVMVLHELTLAFRYATHLIVMKDGAIQATGPVEDVVTEELIKRVYELDCRLVKDPESGRPIVVPRLT